MKTVPIAFLILASLALSPARAQEPVPVRPTAIDRSVMPVAFADAPIVRERFARDEPFVEGRLTYGYGGLVTTDVRVGKRVVVPAGSPAYGIPMISRVGAPQLVWCTFPTPPNANLEVVCLTGSVITRSGNNSLLTAALITPNIAPTFTGGAIESAPFTMGAPIRVAYRVQNLGRISRIFGEAWVGDVKVNEWAQNFGTITHAIDGDERLFAIGGGIIGIRPDPEAKDHYITRIVVPLRAGGNAILSESRPGSAH